MFIYITCRRERQFADRWHWCCTIQRSLGALWPDTSPILEKSRDLLFSRFTESRDCSS